MGKEICVKIAHDDNVRVLRPYRFQHRFDTGEIVHCWGTVDDAKDKFNPFGIDLKEEEFGRSRVGRRSGENLKRELASEVNCDTAASFLSAVIPNENEARKGVSSRRKMRFEPCLMKSGWHERQSSKRYRGGHCSD